jgi:hypothetical protein
VHIWPPIVLAAAVAGGVAGEIEAIPPRITPSSERNTTAFSARVNEASMRIRTDGDKSYRQDIIEQAMRALDENTKTDAVIAACEHARQDRRGKEKALNHPDMTPELAEILSTRELGLTYEVETVVSTED